MAEFVWVSRPDGWGDEAVDLHQCRRFLLSHPNWEWADRLVEYYLLPDGRDGRTGPSPTPCSTADSSPCSAGPCGPVSTPTPVRSGTSHARPTGPRCCGWRV